MPAFVPLIAAVVAAGATVYTTESSKGNKPRPNAPQGLGGSKGPAEIPDVFGRKEKGGPLLGGGESDKPRLSQSLGNENPSPEFGPNQGSTQLDEFLRRQQISSLLGMS
jgi:hypothetical protein